MPSAQPHVTNAPAHSEVGRWVRELEQLLEATVWRLVVSPRLAPLIGELPENLPISRDLRRVLSAIHQAPEAALRSAARLHGYLLDSGIDPEYLERLREASDLVPGEDVFVQDAVARIQELAGRIARYQEAQGAARALATGYDDPDTLARVRETVCRLEHAQERPDIWRPRVALPWRTPDELATSDGEPEWLVEGLLAPNAVTLLYGLPKAGKSTLLAHMVRASLDGGDFLGLKTRTPSVVLLLTEERRRTLAPKLNGLSQERVRVLLRHEVRLPWSEVVAGLVDEVRRTGSPALVIVDTLGAWVGLTDENDAAAAEAALAPLRNLAAAGAAVLLVHHARKGATHEDPEVAQGTSARGSSALAGFADVLVELRRPRAEGTPPNRRELYVISRFDLAPAIVCELRDGRYVALGSREEVRRSADVDELLSALADAAEPLTRSELERRVSLRGQSLTEALSDAVAAGYIVRLGSGRKGDPWRFAAAIPPGELPNSPQVRNSYKDARGAAENPLNPHHDGVHSPQRLSAPELADLAEKREPLPGRVPVSEAERGPQSLVLNGAGRDGRSPWFGSDGAAGEGELVEVIIR